MSEKVVVVSNPSDADLASFHNGEEQRIKDLADFMQGTTVQEGGQHDMFPRGLSTDQGEWNQPPDTTEIVPLVQHQPTFVPTPQEINAANTGEVPQSPGQEHDWKRLYGQSENEKGELRKALQQQMDANNQLLQQVNQFLTQPPPQPQPHPYQQPPYPAPSFNPNYPSYTQVTPNFTNPFSNQPPTIPRFVDRNDGEMVLAEDVEGAVRGALGNFVAPALYNTQEQIRLAREESAQLRQMMLAQEKERRGINPQVEAQALIERPWIRNLQHDHASYLGALGDYVNFKQAQVVLQRQANPTFAQRAPQATLPPTAQVAARRVTYVEGANPLTVEPGNQPNSFDKEFREAATEPNLAKRASKMRQVMTKYNVQQVNDWRDPSIVTR